MKIGFIGLGNMARAMIQGLKNNSNYNLDHVYATRRNLDLLQKQCDELGIHALDSNQALIDAVDIVFLAVKPEDLGSLNLNFEGKMIVSMAAKTTLNTLHDYFGQQDILRIMPNLNVSSNLGSSAYCGDEFTSNQLKDEVARILNILGTAYEIDESQMSGFIALAGSSPALIYRFIDQLAKAGTDEGFDYQMALDIVCQTMIGSATTLSKSSDTPTELVDKVASKGGTTREGLNVFDNLNFDDLIQASAKAIIKKDKLG